MGNSPGKSLTADRTFSGVHPNDDSIINTDKAKLSSRETGEAATATLESPNAVNANENALMFPVPPTGGPRSFVSPRTEQLGGGGSVASGSSSTGGRIGKVSPAVNAQIIDTKGAKNSNTIDTFDFRLTEGQSRRNAMADFETDCTPITDYLFLGGHKVSYWKRFLFF